jgi:hypothetical protein
MVAALNSYPPYLAQILGFWVTCYIMVEHGSQDGPKLRNFERNLAKTGLRTVPPKKVLLNAQPELRLANSFFF